MVRVEDFLRDEIRLAEATDHVDRKRLEKDIFSEEFLLRRPLLEALEAHDNGPPILLADILRRCSTPGAIAQDWETSQSAITCGVGYPGQEILSKTFCDRFRRSAEAADPTRAGSAEIRKIF